MSQTMKCMFTQCKFHNDDCNECVDKKARYACVDMAQAILCEGKYNGKNVKPVRRDRE